MGNGKGQGIGDGIGPGVGPEKTAIWEEAHEVQVVVGEEVAREIRPIQDPRAKIQDRRPKAKDQRPKK